MIAQIRNVTKVVHKCPYVYKGNTKVHTNVTLWEGNANLDSSTDKNSELRWSGRPFVGSKAGSMSIGWELP